MIFHPFQPYTWVYIRAELNGTPTEVLGMVKGIPKQDRRIVFCPMLRQNFDVPNTMLRELTRKEKAQMLKDYYDDD